MGRVSQATATPAGHKTNQRPLVQLNRDCQGEAPSISQCGKWQSPVGRLLRRRRRRFRVGTGGRPRRSSTLTTGWKSGSNDGGRFATVSGYTHAHAHTHTHTREQQQMTPKTLRPLTQVFFLPMESWINRIEWDLVTFHISVVEFDFFCTNFVDKFHLVDVLIHFRQSSFHFIFRKKSFDSFEGIGVSFNEWQILIN